MQFYFDELYVPASKFQVSFERASRSANGMADFLAKQGFNHSCNLIASVE